MMNFLKYLFAILFFLAFVVITFFWFEAEKEVRILCSMFHPEDTAEQVTRTLNTGNLLNVQEKFTDQGQILYVDSPYTLGTSTCTIQFSGDQQVISSQYNQSFTLNKAAAWICAAGFLLMAIFQFLLALGFPYGKIAWGGRYKTLPVSLRMGSAISVLIFFYGSVVLFESAQIIRVLDMPELVEYSVWSLAILFGLSIIGNILSKSVQEKKLMTPIAILFCCLCIIVGMAG